MKTKLFVAVVVLGAASFGAGCDDTTNTGGAGGATASSGSTSTKSSSSGTTTTGTNTGSSSSGAPLCPLTGAMTTTCEQACAALYDCGALTCNGTDLCPGFTGAAAEKMAFVGDAMSGCVETCMDPATSAIKGLIDPEDCAGTINIVKTVSSMAFAPVCENGFSMGTTTASSSSTGP